MLSYQAVQVTACYQYVHRIHAMGPEVHTVYYGVTGECFLQNWPSGFLGRDLAEKIGKDRLQGRGMWRNKGCWIALRSELGELAGLV